MDTGKSLLLGCCVISAGIVIAGNVIAIQLPTVMHGSFTGTVTEGTIQFGEFLSEWEATQFLMFDDVSFQTALQLGEFDGTYTIVQSAGGTRRVFSREKLSNRMNSLISAFENTAISEERQRLAEDRVRQRLAEHEEMRTHNFSIPITSHGVPVDVDVVNLRVSRIVNGETFVEYNENISVMAFPFALVRQGEGIVDFLVEILHPVTQEVYQSRLHQLDFSDQIPEIIIR